MAKITALNGKDSKFEVLETLITQIRNVFPNNNRIIILSFYTETLKYLRLRLHKKGYSVRLMYGKTPYETKGNQKDTDGFPILGRNEIYESFKKGEFEILLVSEVGGEGLDFQFASAMINYDLPYNPMRIEQRIGRIDRMGQKSDKIIVGNLCVQNTIDMAINEVLLTRINNAQALVGDLEPIIAHKLMEMNELIITQGFNEEELKKRTNEISFRIEQEKRALEEFEKSKNELINDSGFKDEFGNSIKNSIITPQDSLLYTNSFLKKEKGCWCKISSDTAAEIHLTKDLCAKLKTFIDSHNFGKNALSMRKLIQNNGTLMVEFNGNEVYDNNQVHFFKPAGPWIEFINTMILDSEESENTFYGSLPNNEALSFEQGRYWLFIFEISFEGYYDMKENEYVLIREDGEYMNVLSLEEKRYIQANIKNTKIPEDINVELYDALYNEAQFLIEEKEQVLEENILSSNNVKITSRIQALKNLSEKRIESIQSSLETSDFDNEKINKSIAREKEKTEAKINILMSKMNNSISDTFQGVCVIDVK